MTQALTILIDVDSVVADIVTPWLAEYRRQSGHQLYPSDITAWDVAQFVLPGWEDRIYRIPSDPGFYYQVQPMTGALIGVNALRDLGHRVVFVTANHHVTPRGRKLQWLVDHDFLNPSDTEDYVEADDKSLIRGDILLDDSVHNVTNFTFGGGVLFDHPWNNEFPWPFRIYSWTNFVHVIRDNIIQVTEKGNIQWARG